MRVLVLVVVAGCGRIGFDSRAGDGRVHDGIANGDTAIVGDSVLAANCGTTTIVADDFAGSSLAATWSSYNLGGPGLTLSVTGGALDIQYAPVVQAARSSGIDQMSPQDIHGICFITELLDAPNPATAYVLASISGSSAGSLYYKVFGGQIEALFSDGMVTLLGPFPWSAVNQRFLRIEQSGTTFTLDTAPAIDGPYTAFGTVSVGAFDLSAATIELDTTTTATTNSGGAARFGSVYELAP